MRQNFACNFTLQTRSSSGKRRPRTAGDGANRLQSNNDDPLEIVYVNDVTEKVRGPNNKNGRRINTHRINRVLSFIISLVFYHCQHCHVSVFY